MKKLILLLLFIPLVSFGQKSNDTDALKLCVALQTSNFTTDSEAEDAVNKILSVIGASQKPVLQPCSNINNAVAAVYKGQRYILYDRDFMNSLTAGSNKYWSNMFILAHELGHHINGHSLDIILYANDIIDPKSLEEKRKQELEADEFAGFVLAKLGASLSQTSKILSNIPRISNENSSTHPSKDKRIASVRIGFKKGEVKKVIVANKTVKINKNSNSKTTNKEELIVEKINNDIINVNSNWTYYTETQKEIINNNDDLDPFATKDLEDETPLIKKIITAKGKSINNTNKNLNLRITINKWSNPYGISNFNLEKYPADDIDDTDIQLERSNGYEVEIMLKDWEEAPNINYEDIYGGRSNSKWPKDRLMVKIEYIVDNNKGFLWAVIDSGRNDDLEKPLNLLKLPLKEEIGPLRYGSELDYFRLYKQKKHFDKQNTFLNLLRSGESLYLKFSDLKKFNPTYGKHGDILNDDNITSKIKPTIYIFNLKGSAESLIFPKLN